MVPNRQEITILTDNGLLFYPVYVKVRLNNRNYICMQEYPFLGLDFFFTFLLHSKVKFFSEVTMLLVRPQIVCKHFTAPKYVLKNVPEE